jgi:hypothetical protein
MLQCRIKTRILLFCVLNITVTTFVLIWGYLKAHKELVSCGLLREGVVFESTAEYDVSAAKTHSR